MSEVETTTNNATTACPQWKTTLGNAVGMVCNIEWLSRMSPAQREWIFREAARRAEALASDRVQAGRAP